MNNNFWNVAIFKVGNFDLLVSELFTAILILMLTFLASKFVRKGLKRLILSNSDKTPAHFYVIGRIAHYVILMAGALMSVSALGIDLSKLTLIASALGIGVGLGLQSIVNDFLSRLALLLEKSLKVGDFIELASGVVGDVIEIHMRATLVRTNDNVDILIPNAELTCGLVTNCTLEGSTRRFRIRFSVAYGTDKNLVKMAALEAALSVDYTLRVQGREPVVWMTGFGGSSLNFVLCVWVTAEHVRRPTGMTSDYLWTLEDALRKYNIEIPFPQRDIHVKNGVSDLKNRLIYQTNYNTRS